MLKLGDLLFSKLIFQLSITQLVVRETCCIAIFEVQQMLQRLYTQSL